MVRHLGRPGHHRHLRRAPLRAGRRRRRRVNSMHYLWKGRCLPIEVLDRVNNITPNADGPEPAQTFRLQAQRTIHGVVTQARDGRRQAGRLRQPALDLLPRGRLGARLLEVQPAVEDPERARLPGGRQRHRLHLQLVLRRRPRHLLLQLRLQPGPRRRAPTPSSRPGAPASTTGRAGTRARTSRAGPRSTPTPRSSTRTTSPAGTTSRRRASRPPRTPTPSARSTAPIRSTSGSRAASPARTSMTLVELIDAMEDAGTVDLRGSQALPVDARRCSRRAACPSDLADEVATLQRWVANGAHRRDRDRSGVYDDAAAVRLMDAWWPLALEGIFKAELGDDLFNKLKAKIAFDDPPGSRRQRLHQRLVRLRREGPARDARPEGRRARTRAATAATARARRSSVRTCKAKLEASLRAATAIPDTTLYPRGDNCATGDAQVCNDAVRFSALGGIRVKRDPLDQPADLAAGRRGPGPPRPRHRAEAARSRASARTPSERLQGSAFPDRLTGKGGNDQLFAEGGKDCLNGGPGNDKISAGGDVDRVKGGSGDDQIGDGRRQARHGLVRVGDRQGQRRLEGQARGRLRAGREEDRRQEEGRARRRSSWASWRRPLRRPRRCSCPSAPRRGPAEVAQVPLGVEGALGAGARGGDRLAVGVVDEVADREDAGELGPGRGLVGDDVAVLVGVDLALDQLGARAVADRDERAADREVLRLAGLGVLQAQRARSCRPRPRRTPRARRGSGTRCCPCRGRAAP